jgi:hypothetical protein
MTNPLVAKAPEEGSGFTKGTGDNGWATGVSIAESAMDTFNGFKDGNWIEGGLGVVGLAADAASMAIDPFGTLMSSAASFLMEHVQPLKDMLDWLAGDPPVIESYSTTWNNVSTEMGKISKDYAAALQSGTEGWTGAAADAYRAAAAQQGDALTGAASAAGSVATVVGVMGMVVAFVREMVRDLIADLIAKLIAWVLEAVFSLGFGTPVIVAQAITAISKWAARIAKLVQKLLDTIKKVSPMLKRLVEIFEKIMKVLGKIAGKATGLDVFGTKFDDPGFLKKLGRDGVDTPSGSPTGSSPSGRSDPDGPDTSPDGTSPSTRTPDSTPTSTSANPSNSPSPNGSQSPARDTSGPGDTTPSQTHSTPSATTPSAHTPAPHGPGSTPAGHSPTPSTHNPDSTPSGPSPSSSPTPHSPSTAPNHSPNSPGSTPPSRSPGNAPSGHSPNSPGPTPASHSPASTPTAHSPGGSPTPHSPGNAPSHSPNSPGNAPSSHSPAPAPAAHGPTGNPGPSPSGHSPTSPSSGPPRVDQTHSSATATPDAPHRADQPQTAPPRDTSPSSAPQQPSPGGAAHAGGQPGGSPSAGGPPRTGGGGWTGTSGHRGDTASGVPQSRPHETPGGTSRPQSAPPPHAAGPPSARPNAGPPPFRPQAGPPHAGPPHAGPPHAGPPQARPPQAGPPRQGPPHQGPPRQGPPHQNAPHQPQPRGPQPGPPHDRGGVPPHRDPNGAPHHDGPSPDGHHPPHTPEPRPNIDEAHARHGETTPAGVSHHRGDPDMGDLPSRVPNDPRYFTADVHITPDGRARIGNHTYSPEEYGDLLRRSGWDGKTPIRLIGCDAGSNDFAKRLSAHTDAPVLAPTKPAWTDSKGRVFTSDAEVDANGNRQPKIPPNGEWETHSPDGTRTKASEDGFVPGTHDKDKGDLDPSSAKDRAATADDEARAGRDRLVARANSDPDFFRKNYNIDGHRKQIDRIVDGHPLPQIKNDPKNPGKWIAASDAPPPLPKKYQTGPGSRQDGVAKTVPEEHRKTIDDAAARRDRAIVADQKAEATLDEAKEKLTEAKQRTKDAEERLATDDSPEAQKAHEDAKSEQDRAQQKYDKEKEEHKAPHHEMGKAGEHLGDNAAEFHAIPENYPGADRIDNRAEGNNRFDQIWRREDGGFVVVEAKAPSADLGARDSLTGRKVQQGRLDYFESILAEMQKRGAKGDLAEAALAIELRKALDAGNVDYVVVRAQATGGTYDGYSLKHFDLNKEAQPGGYHG